MLSHQVKDQVIEIYEEALKAADPIKCVLDHVELKGSRFSVDSRTYNLDLFKSLYVIAFGKAAPAMAKAVEDVLANRIKDGIVVSNSQPQFEFKRSRFYLSSHPVPDKRSLSAADEVLKLLEGTGEEDLVIFLISGGGSALLAMPASGISLKDKQKTTLMLLNSGVDNYGLNAVRKHISQIKGGGLLKKALPAQVITLILSNVVGDRLDAIASGPTVPDPTTFDDACRVIEALRLEHRIPPQVMVHLEDGRRGNLDETLKEHEYDHKGVQTIIVGSNFKCLIAAKKRARQLGYNTFLLSSQISGEAREVAKVIAAIAFDIERFNTPVKKPACIIFGGETSVTIRGNGKGGRNTETALSFSMEIMDHDILGLFCGTDGIDGPTDATGAICDGGTRKKAREMKLSARECLSQNDSYRFFDRLEALVKVGSTGTNVMDIGIVVLK
ncbi:MAG: glycerate kinase [Deltaproteobacteria bacterium]|nr:glycerate kinase [Deltaproteobacteria bacterium]